MKLVRLNMNEDRIEETELPSEYEGLGGRALTSTIISREVPPECHPLGPRNKLVIAPGLLAGTASPCSNKLSVGAKSPLTGGIKESNVGGLAAYRLARLGIAGIVIEGKSGHFHPHVAVIGARNHRIERADELAGLGNYEVHRQLQEKYGPKAAVLSIGPAGELRLAGACVISNDTHDHPGRAAGRGGMGAVMGAKSIKAIIIPQSRSEKAVEPSDPDAFKTATREFTEKLQTTQSALTRFGTALMVDLANTVQGLPTRNYRAGVFEGAENINAGKLVENIEARGGEISAPCSPGCPIRCSNTYPGPDGNYLTSSLEYETICLMGSNLGIDDLDAIARLDKACDDLGLDTIETGATLGVAMEAGLIAFGDAEGAMGLLDEVARGSIMGRAIGSGVVTFCKLLGIDRVPAVKGQSFPAYDPRTFKGMGATFATSPMGADHTAGPATPGRTGLDPNRKVSFNEPDGQAELTRDLQTLVAVVDQLGVCLFAGPDAPNLPIYVKLLNALFGWKLSEDDLLEMGRKLLRTEREFNTLAGIDHRNDGLPEWLSYEPSPPSERVFDVDPEELRKMEY